MFSRFPPRLIAIAMVIAFLTVWSNVGEASEIKNGPNFLELKDELQEFRLNDGSTISVDYHHGKISIELGESGPKMKEDFKEDDFGGIYWDWGQVTPQADGTWIYEDWLNEGYKSEAIPVPLL